MFEQKLITSMRNFNQLIHVLLALALGIACVMVIWDFGLKAAEAWQAGRQCSEWLFPCTWLPLHFMDAFHTDLCRNDLSANWPDLCARIC